VREAEALGIVVFAGTEASKSSVFVPIVASDRVLGSIVLENYEREHAFGDADVRLLAHGRRRDGRGAGERAPVRRDAAAAGSRARPTTPSSR
jgi:hypothetical protein